MWPLLEPLDTEAGHYTACCVATGTFVVSRQSCTEVYQVTSSSEGYKHLSGVWMDRAVAGLDLAHYITHYA